MKFPPHFIFRGHANHEQYKLLPGIFREKTIEGGTITQYSQLEYNIISDFIAEAKRYVHEVDERNLLGWLEIAQHFGVPTRLLDFTENPLIALFFACQSESKNAASVWVLNESEYARQYCKFPLVEIKNYIDAAVDQIVYDEVFNMFSPQQNPPEQRIMYPWIYKPVYREERMVTQSSKFMIWGQYRGALTDFLQDDQYMTLDEYVDNANTGILGAITIPQEYKHSIIEQLRLLGVNEKFVYAGLEGVGRYINKKYASE